MTILLSDSAALHIEKHIRKRAKGIGIKIAVKTTGCSGLGYKLEFVDIVKEDDMEFVDKNIRIFVDKKSLPYIDGTVLDYVKEGLNEGFKFKNPNAKGECGCGESFTV